MTLEEAIKHAEEVAEENQRVFDKHIVFGDVKIDIHYCDDPKVTEEYLVNCQMCAKEHKQLVEWLKDYKRLLEQEPKIGQWKRIGYDIYECSICGQDVMTGDICAYRHCHCCGAKMIEPQEREE